MIKEGLVFWNPWWDAKASILEDVKERHAADDLQPLFNRKEVLALTGVRRSGKTSMMYLLIRDLLQKHNPKQILYVNLDDPSLQNASLQEIYAKYEEMAIPESPQYLFLDEIQNKEGWERWVKKMYDSHKKVKIVVTGSNSSLLKTEYSTHLAGRNLSYEVYPLTFPEYLAFKGEKIQTETQILNRRPTILRHLEEYLKFGGYPEVVLEDKESMKTALLKEYFSAILSRDILTRYDIKERVKLEKLAFYLITNTACEVSATRLADMIGLNIRTVQEYLNHLEETYLFSFVNHFSYSLKAQLTYPRKVYCVDTGMKNAVSFSFSKDIGRIMENMIYLKLRRMGEVYYWRTQSADVDFILKQHDKVTQIIQSCYSLDDEKTRRREVKSLEKAMEHFNLDQGTIITWNTEDTTETDGKEIHYTPLWKWSLIT